MAWTTTDLAAIDAAIATGATEVRHGEKTIKYRDLAEMKQTRDMIQQSLQAPKQRRCTLATFERDL
jgi:hypothetical protein